MRKLPSLFTAILTVFLFALPAHAADITLNSRCTLTDAIIAANSDRAEGGCPAGRGADTITLSQDITLRDELPAITSEITIEGGGYTISGDNRYRIFYNGGALTINDLTMTKGQVENKGGAIVNWKGTLAISGSRFIRNSAEQGGAVYNAGELSISGSSLNHNSALNHHPTRRPETGGAVFNADGGELSIINSSFSGNRADAYGGAIHNGGELSIINSSFTGNSANWEGGAVFNADGGELRIATSSFTDNWAQYRGGAIYSSGGISITSASFSDNHAYGDEGGAVVNEGELRITRSSFTDNSAADGGVIFNRGELSIANASFSGNSAGSGGAVSNVEKLSVSASSFTNNSADLEGGAVINWGGELSISASSFSGNSANWEGGAVVNWGGELSVSASSFTNNSARGDSGALFNVHKGEARIINSAFSANSDGNGYGLAVGETGTVYLRNVIIASHLEYACHAGSGGLFIHDSYSHAFQDDSYARAPQGDLRLGALVVPEDGSQAQAYYPILADCPETD